MLIPKTNICETNMFFLTVERSQRKSQTEKKATESTVTHIGGTEQSVHLKDI